MILSQKTLEQLRIIINETSEYRSGPQLVSFFKEFGFQDSYGQGFPSRWVYTQERLEKINGTPELDKCIKKVFAPINYVGNYERLQQLIDEFNQYLSFDGWKVIRQGKEIIFCKANFEEPAVEKKEMSEQDFLAIDFSLIDLSKLSLESTLVPVIQQRIDEITKSIECNLPLSAVILCGSTLEGILLGLAQKNPKAFNQSATAPKKDGKVKSLQDWTLDNLINVSCELGFIDLDVKKFSHALKDFRNFIHPYEQMMNNFNPTMDTAKISAQVLKAAISQLNRNHKYQ